MFFKTILVLYLAAALVNAEDDGYGEDQHQYDDKACFLCGEDKKTGATHTYVVNNWNFDAGKGTWRLVLTNDLPPEAKQKCIHWALFPNDNTYGNINRCWNSDTAKYQNWDCGQKNGGGIVTYSRDHDKVTPSLGAFNWESARWTGKQEYFVVAFEPENLWILIRCAQVNGKNQQYIYVFVKDNAEWKNSEIRAKAIEVMKFNNLNPSKINPSFVSQDPNVCSWINSDLSLPDKH